MADTFEQVTNRIALWREQIEEGHQGDGIGGSAEVLLDSLISDVLEAAALAIEVRFPFHSEDAKRCAEIVRTQKRST